MNAPKHRWLRFRLRTMFVLVTAVALWLGWELRIVRQRRAAVAELRGDPSAQVFTVMDYEIPFDMNDDMPTVPWLRRFLGDVPVELIRYPAGRNESDKRRLKTLFPEADVGEL
jgi:hypothetical protein